MFEVSFHNSFHIAFVRIIMLIQYKIYKESKADIQLVRFFSRYVWSWGDFFSLKAHLYMSHEHPLLVPGICWLCCCCWKASLPRHFWHFLWYLLHCLLYHLALITIWKSLKTAFGLGQGFPDKKSWTSSKNAGFLVGIPFPVFPHSSL